MEAMISNVHSGLAGTPARLVASVLALLLAQDATVPSWLKEFIVLLASTTGSL